jgi:prephenate dehydrogenase
MFEKMVLAGVGLICGSLALDMRRRNLVKEVVGYGRSESNLKVAKKKSSSTAISCAKPIFPRASISS